MSWLTGAYRKALGVGRLTTAVERRSVLGVRVLLGVRYHARGCAAAKAELPRLAAELVRRVAR